MIIMRTKILLILFFGFRVLLYSLGWCGTNCVVHASLRHGVIFLPLPFDCWDYGCAQPRLTRKKTPNFKTFFCIYLFNCSMCVCVGVEVRGLSTHLLLCRFWICAYFLNISLPSPALLLKDHNWLNSI